MAGPIPAEADPTLGIEQRSRLALLVWSGAVVGYLLMFAACLFLIYVLVPQMMLLTSSTFYNLSLLTSDVFAVLASAIIFQFVPSALYFVALVAILAGLIIYHAVPVPATTPTTT